MDAADEVATVAPGADLSSADSVACQVVDGPAADLVVAAAADGVAVLAGAEARLAAGVTFGAVARKAVGSQSVETGLESPRVDPGGLTGSPFLFWS